MTSFKSVPPKAKVSPQQAKLFVARDKWAELREAIDTLKPDGDGVQMVFSSLAEMRSIQSYALTYIHQTINPPDYHLETQTDIPTLTLTLWKISGGRVVRDMTKRLDAAKIGEAVTFKTDGKEDIKALQRAANKYGVRRQNRGFRITTKTIEDVLFVWKISF